MSLIIRPRDGFAILHAHLSLDAFDRIVPRTTIVAVLDACHARETRTRKLPAVLVVLICIAMNLAAADALTHVFFRLVQTLRWRLPTPSAARVSKSALSQARSRLGARPLVALFHQVCQPLATAATPDALLFGLRPFALDSTVFDLPDTPANAAAFGRPHNGRGVGAWPQAQLLALCECATHAICEAGVWPCAASAARVGRRLVRGVGRGDLLLWDREFHSFAILAATRARHAHLLGRLPAGAHPPVLRTLRDGTQLVRVQPTDRHQQHHGTHLLLRLIRYTLDDPARPGHAIEHRLVTSLLNPCHAPAQILVEAYHARWEFAVAADELENPPTSRYPPAQPEARRCHPGTLRPAHCPLPRARDDGRSGTNGRPPADPPQFPDRAARDSRDASYPARHPADRAAPSLPATARRPRRCTVAAATEPGAAARRQAAAVALCGQTTAPSPLAPTHQTLPRCHSPAKLNRIGLKPAPPIHSYATAPSARSVAIASSV